MSKIQQGMRYKVGAFHKRKKEMITFWELNEVTSALIKNNWDSRSTAKELGMKWDTFFLLIKKLGFTTKRGIVQQEDK